MRNAVNFNFKKTMSVIVEVSNDFQESAHVVPLTVEFSEIVIHSSMYCADNNFLTYDSGTQQKTL